MPQQQKVTNVRLVNKSRYRLELVAPAQVEGGIGATLRIPARGKLDVAPEEWSKFEKCRGAVQFRDKLKWIIVAEMTAKAKAENLLEMTAKLAIETANMSTNELELHAWRDAEEERPKKRDDVIEVIDARLVSLAQAHSVKG